MILRPAEVIPALIGLPIYEGLILGTVALSYRNLRWQLSKQALCQQPITICILGILVAVILSHVSHLYLYGAQESAVSLLKTTIYYLLLVGLVDTPERLRRFLRWVAVVSSLMISLCVVDYLGVYDLEFVQHTSDSDGVTLTNTDNRIHRMNGTGLFSDPNDISLLIVATGVLCVYFLSDKARGAGRFGWLVPLGLLASALLFTHSRGGLLAAGGAAFILVLLRYGRKAAFAMAAMGVCLLPFIAGRQGSIDLSSGTGHERLLLWRDGLQAIKSPDILFGVGQGLYAEFAGLVAHNSFVHAYVELGLFGGTFFFGCFFFAAVSLYRLRYFSLSTFAPELVRLTPYVAAVMAGWGTGLLSLSRCYVVPTYMVFGIAACFFNCAGRAMCPPRALVTWNRKIALRLAGASLGMFVCLNVFVYIFAQ